MPNSSIYRALGDVENLTAEGEVAGRIRGPHMSVEDEAKIRPAVVKLVKARVLLL